MTLSSKAVRGAVLIVLVLLIIVLFREPIAALLRPEPPASPYLATPKTAKGAADCLEAANAFNRRQDVATAEAVEQACRRESRAMGFGPCRQWANRAMRVGLFFPLSQRPNAAGDVQELKHYRRQARFAAGLCEAVG